LDRPDDVETDRALVG